MKYTLEQAIVIDGNKDATPITISELTFRDSMCAGDLRDLPLSALADPMTMPTGQALRIAGRLCGHPDAVMNKLQPRDTAEVVAVVLGFFKAGPETGTTPSP